MSRAASNVSGVRAGGSRQTTDRIIATSGLPAPLADVVRRVVDATRLWRRERTDVARELCSHFLDGLESGATPEALLASFGDARSVAALITSAKKRSRPLWWRAWRGTLRAAGWTAVACTALYAVFAARYFLSSPKITHNYSVELRAAALASTGHADLGWPLYLKAMREFGANPEFMQSEHPDPRRPGDPNFDVMAQYLDSHPEALATLRQAAAKPIVGYPWSDAVDPEYSLAMEVVNPKYKYDPASEIRSENPLLIGVLLPHLGQMRGFARRLGADAHLAASRGDTKRFVADIEALAGMADQTLREPFLISQLVGLAISQLLNNAVLEELSRPDFLDAPSLQSLAHRIAAIGGGRVLLDATGEVLMVQDVIQRFYSDDGNGNGHLTGASKTRNELYTSWGAARPKGEILLEAFRPVQGAILLPSRAEISARLGRFQDAFGRDNMLPPWKHAERTSDEHYRWLMHSVLGRIWVAIESLQGGDPVDGSMNVAFLARDKFEVTRSATLTALALRSYQKAHGSYPATLAELSPAYLPVTPEDPIDGNPLRYLAPIDGRPPVLYSIGSDGVDDAGRSPESEQGQNLAADLKFAFRKRDAASTDPAFTARLNAARGDWILWPVSTK